MKPLLRRHYCTLLNPSPTPSRIIELCRSGELLEAIHLLNTLKPPQKILSKPILYASLIQTCTKSHSFSHGLQFHAHAIKSGLETDRFVANSLLALYFKLGKDFFQTRKVFDSMVYKDVVSWTSMISGYIRVNRPGVAIEFYVKMMDFGIEPNGYSLSAVIKACSEIGELRLGKSFHGVVIKCGFDDNVVILSSLIDMYGRNFRPDDSCNLFDEMPHPDTICWTAVISSLTRNDLYGKALGLFYFVHRKYGWVLEEFMFGSVVNALGNLGRVKQGKEMHAKVVLSGLCGNVFVESSLVDMYAKCGLVEESQRVFDKMGERNSVSWCALLGGYCQKGRYEKVIDVFRKMEDFDLYSFATILRACSGLAAIKPGKEVHCQYVKRGGWRDIIVESALIDLYAKCGFVDYAYSMFTKMQVRNLITWNSMLSGFAQNGRGKEAIELFDQMISEEVTPDYITFISVLFACSHSGLVHQGRSYFALMTERFRIRAGMEHYSCMVDLLGRSGELEEAEDLIETSEFKNDSSLWAALLGACTTSTKPTVAERIAKRMMELKPHYHLSYVLLANVYRAIGRWNDALEIWKQMQDRGVKKMPGKSWIESDSTPDSLLVDSDML